LSSKASLFWVNLLALLGHSRATERAALVIDQLAAGGRRMSAAHCYLDPVRNCQNLRIETRALTEGLVLDGRVALVCATPSPAMCARPGRSARLSLAGAFNSPQLLELSGIGQAERLCNLGIEVRHELPGVGENLRDHYVPRTRWLVDKKGITFNDRGRGLGLAHQALRYALFREGMLAMTGAPVNRLRLRCVVRLTAQKSDKRRSDRLRNHKICIVGLFRPI
jgi:choline dehydrogenase